VFTRVQLRLEKNKL